MQVLFGSFPSVIWEIIQVIFKNSHLISINSQDYMKVYFYFSKFLNLFCFNIYSLDFIWTYKLTRISHCSYVVIFIYNYSNKEIWL